MTRSPFSLLALSGQRFASTRTITILCGVHEPKASLLRLRLETLAESGKLFRPLDTKSEVTCIDLGGVDDADFPRIALQVSSDSAYRYQAILLVTQSAVSLIHSHSLGDGYVSEKILWAVLHGSEPVTLAQDLSAYRFSQAVMSSCGKRALIGGLARTIAVAKRNASFEIAGKVAYLDIPSHAYVKTQVLSGSNLYELKLLRGKVGDEVSLSTMILYGACKIISEYSPEYSTLPYRFAVSLRRYSKSLKNYGGNLIDFAEGDVSKGTMIEELHRDISDQLVSGTPAIKFALKNVRQIFASATTNDALEAISRPLLTFSSRGYVDETEFLKIAWSGTARTYIGGLIEPDGKKIAINLSRTQDSIFLTLSCRRSLHPDDLLSELDEYLAQPHLPLQQFLMD